MVSVATSASGWKSVGRGAEMVEEGGEEERVVVVVEEEEEVSVTGGGGGVWLLAETS